MKLSKKKPNNMGGNALSENWFYHLIVEWLPNHWNMYEYFEEVFKDIEEYVTDVVQWNNYYNQRKSACSFY